MRLVASLNWEVFGVYMEMVRIEPLGVQKVFRIWVNDLMMCGDRVGWWGWDEMVFFLDLNLCQPSKLQNIRPFSWEKVSWVIQFCVWVFFLWNSPNEQKFFRPGGHSEVSRDLFGLPKTMRVCVSNKDSARSQIQVEGS